MLTKITFALKPLHTDYIHEYNITSPEFISVNIHTGQQFYVIVYVFFCFMTLTFSLKLVKLTV